MSLSASDQKDVLLAEFSALSSEKNARMAAQLQLIYLVLIGVAAFAGLHTRDSTLDGRAYLVLAASSVMGLLWVDQHLGIHRIGYHAYTRVWPYFDQLREADLPSMPCWEEKSHGRNLRGVPEATSRWLFIGPIGVLFAAPAVTGIALSYRGIHLDGFSLVWVLSVALVVAFLVAFVLIVALRWRPRDMR